MKTDEKIERKKALERHKDKLKHYGDLIETIEIGDMHVKNFSRRGATVQRQFSYGLIDSVIDRYKEAAK